MVLGRQVELEFIDAGRPPREVAAQVAALVDAGPSRCCDGVAHLFGAPCSGSGDRREAPYVYTSLYEGVSAAPGSTAAVKCRIFRSFPHWLDGAPSGQAALVRGGP